MHEQGAVAVIGAGVIGSAVAYASRAKPFRAAHRSSRARNGGGELRQCGPYCRRAYRAVPFPTAVVWLLARVVCLEWSARYPNAPLAEVCAMGRAFCGRAFRRRENAAQLAALVKPACATLARWLQELGRPQLCNATATMRSGCTGTRNGGRTPRHKRCSGSVLSTAPAPAALLDLQRGPPPAPRTPADCGFPTRRT